MKDVPARGAGCAKASGTRTQPAQSIEGLAERQSIRWAGWRRPLRGYAGPLFTVCFYTHNYPLEKHGSYWCLKQDHCLIFLRVSIFDHWTGLIGLWWVNSELHSSPALMHKARVGSPKSQSFLEIIAVIWSQYYIKFLTKIVTVIIIAHFI